MEAEIKAIERNHTQESIELPANAKKIGVKWIYKTKLNEHGIEYIEVFDLVARLDSVKMVNALAAQRGWTIFQLDIKSAFLCEP